MTSLRRALADFDSAISTFAEYLGLWVDMEANPECAAGYSIEFVAYMLLRAKGELDRYALVLEGRRESYIKRLLRTKDDLVEQVFNKVVLSADGERIRKAVLDSLDCRSLVPDLNEYLGLHDYYASKSVDESTALRTLEDIGIDLLLKRDELQLVMDQLDTLATGKCMSPQSREVLRNKRGDLQDIDEAIRNRLGAFRRLAPFVRDFRQRLGGKALDQGIYWWWFLDEQRPIERWAPKLMLSPQEVRRVAQQLANSIDCMGRREDGKQHDLRLLSIGQLAYRLLLSSASPSDKQPLTKFAHGALNQALILLAYRADLSRYAEVCYSLSLVCCYIADWTCDVNIAERALRLQLMASDHLRSEDMASLGLEGCSPQDAEALINRLNERKLKAGQDREAVSSRAVTPAILDLKEALEWLHSRYRVEPRGKGGLWVTIKDILRQGAALPEAFMELSMAETMETMRAGGTARDERRGELLAGLRPGMKGWLYWPYDGRDIVSIVLSIEDRDKLGLVWGKPVQIVLWSNVPPPLRLDWADWVMRGKWEGEIGANKWSRKIPITKRYLSFDNEQKEIVRNWIYQSLVIEPPSQETIDSQ